MGVSRFVSDSGPLRMFSAGSGFEDFLKFSLIVVKPTQFSSVSQYIDESGNIVNSFQIARLARVFGQTTIRIRTAASVTISHGTLVPY